MKNRKSIQNMQDADIKSFMDYYKIEIKIEDNETKIYINGELAKEEELQSKEASIAVSKVGGVADNTRLFEFARDLIDTLKKDYNIIISGRGIMQIYPDTDYHFFITADLQERIRRKCIQYKNELTKQEVEENILKRDELQEKAGFYKLHKNTITIDVTHAKTIKEATKMILEQIPKVCIK